MNAVQTPPGITSVPRTFSVRVHADDRHRRNMPIGHATGGKEDCQRRAEPLGHFPCALRQRSLAGEAGPDESGLKLSLLGRVHEARRSDRCGYGEGWLQLSHPVCHQLGLVTLAEVGQGGRV